MFYVYEWFVKETNEVFYVGKGCGRRYKVRKHNKFFNDFIKRYDCDSRIVKEFEDEEDAFAYEHERISELKSTGQCVCNIYDGGAGGTQSCWSDERRQEYSKKNVMKSENQRMRMSANNPMKNKKTAKQVGEKHRRAVIINGKRFDSVFNAAKGTGVSEITIRNWCRNGHNSNNEPCYYEDGNPVKKQNKKPYKHKLSSIAKAVYIDGVLYKSMADAAKALGVNQSNLRFAINRNGLYKGHKCEYANQQPSRGKSDNSTTEGSTTNE